jgi:hypothetical protein
LGNLAFVEKTVPSIWEFFMARIFVWHSRRKIKSDQQLVGLLKSREWIAGWKEKRFHPPLIGKTKSKKEVRKQMDSHHLTTDSL